MPISWSFIRRTFSDSLNSPKGRRGGSRRGAAASTRRGRFETLEDRSVLSATFGSALNAGRAIYDVATDTAGNSYVTGSFGGTVDFDLGSVHANDADTLTARGASDAFIAKYLPDNALLWVRRMGGDSSGGLVNDAGRSVTLDAAGNVYLAGEFAQSSDFGATTLVSAGDADGFVAKLNADGTFAWAKRWGGTSADSGHGVGVDLAGNVYALGLRWQQGHDLLKFTSNGGQVWSMQVANSSMAGSSDISVSSNGDVFLAGRFNGTVDFDPSAKVKSVSSGPSTGGFALKIDTSGRFQWVTPFVGRTVSGVSGYAFATSVSLDPSGNVVVGGLYSGSVDFNPGTAVTTPPVNAGGFIAKLSSSGGLTWVRALEASSTTFVYGLAVDAAGSIYATGSFYGLIDLNPSAETSSHASAGGSDTFIVKLTSAGNFSWGETFGGTGTDVGWDLVVDSTGVIHLAGQFAGVVDFDSDPFAAYQLGTTGQGTQGLRLRLRQS